MVAPKPRWFRCRDLDILPNPGVNAIRGATMCRFHGGAAAHVKREARERHERAADRMAKALLGIATDGLA